MTQWLTHRSVLGLSLSIFLAACGTQTAPTSPSLSTSGIGTGDAAAAGRPASRCVNVSVQGVADLGIVNSNLGALPFDTKIGAVEGKMSSFIVPNGVVISGSKGQGAWHITLKHRFESSQGWFETEDRAVCAVAGSAPNVCRVNDVLQIVGGGGVFDNAGGSLTNHGTITLTGPVSGSLTVDLKGRVCGDGL